MKTFILAVVAILVFKEWYVFNDESIIHATFLSLLFIMILQFDLTTIFSNQRESIRNVLKTSTVDSQKNLLQSLTFIPLNSDLQVLFD